MSNVVGNSRRLIGRRAARSTLFHSSMRDLNDNALIDTDRVEELRTAVCDLELPYLRAFVEVGR